MQFLSGAEIVLSYNRMGGQKDTAVREEEVAKLLLAAIRRSHHTQGGSPDYIWELSASCYQREVSHCIRRRSDITDKSVYLALANTACSSVTYTSHR